MKKIFVSIVAAVSAFSFSNCANPYAPGASNVQRDTTTGGILGAAAGGIIGNQSGRAIEGALLGGGAGALLGSQVGLNKDANN